MLSIYHRYIKVNLLYYSHNHNIRLLFLHLYTDFLFIDIFQNSILNTKLN